MTVLATLPAVEANGTANGTTLTTAQAALLTSDGNALDFATKGGSTSLSAVNAAGVQVATKTLDTYLANLLTGLGLSSSFDPVGTAFTANHTGADALIDMIAIVPEGAATYLVYKTPVASSTATQSSTRLLDFTLDCDKPRFGLLCSGPDRTRIGGIRFVTHDEGAYRLCTDEVDVVTGLP